MWWLTTGQHVQQVQYFVGEVRNDAEHLSSPQQVHEIEPVKTSTKHSSMRNDRIPIIYAALDSAQFVP